MAVGKTWVRLGLALLLLWGSGCAGVLLENRYEDGRVGRLKIDGGEGWSDYEDKPRYPGSKTKDEYYIVIKKELSY